MSAKKDATTGYVLTRMKGTAGDYLVEKWKDGSPVSAYRVEGGVCNCQAGDHGTPCKHLEMVVARTRRQPQPMPTAEASKVVRALLEAFRQPDSGFSWVDFAGYEYDDKGQVVRAKIEGLGDVDGDTSGTYRGFRDGLLVEVKCQKSA